MSMYNKYSVDGGMIPMGIMKLTSSSDSLLKLIFFKLSGETISKNTQTLKIIYSLNQNKAIY